MHKLDSCELCGYSTLPYILSEVFKMNSQLQQVRIVLIGTTHPGNIGAAARALKTMGQTQLYLVDPKIYPSAEATARATGADDILANAIVCDDIKQAIKDCELVMATTARKRSLPWPVVTPRQCAEKVYESQSINAAILFGRESSGLSNEELELSNMMLQIPANPEYSSLNLAAAVQIICYELKMQSYIVPEIEHRDNETELVTYEKMEMLYEHLADTMQQQGFLDINNPGRLMHRMRRLFNRARVEEAEWSILRGFLASIQKKNKD